MIQTKLQEEALITKILQDDLKVPFYFRSVNQQRKLCLDLPEGGLDLIWNEEGFMVSEEERRLERFQPFLQKLQQLYALERIKELAQRAGYALGPIQHGKNQEIIFEVSKW